MTLLKTQFASVELVESGGDKLALIGSAAVVLCHLACLPFGVTFRVRPSLGHLGRNTQLVWENKQQKPRGRRAEV